ncbi:hypothetical protein BJX70DRAFT_367940 [Aspergillus crustosus]
MWSPLAKSDQRSETSERRQSGSSAAPQDQNQNQNPDSGYSAKGGNTTNPQEQEQEQEQEPQYQDQQSNQEEQEQEQPSTPSPEEQKKVREPEQREDTESQASGPAGSSGSGIFGKLKSLGGGLTSQVTQTVQSVPNIATKPLELLKGLSVQDGGEIPGPDGNIVGRVIEGGEEAVGGTVQEGGKIVNEAGETIGQAELTDEVKDTIPDIAGKPLELLKGLEVRDGGEISGPDGNIIGRVVEGGEEAIGGTVQEGGKIVNQAGETIGQAELTDEVKNTVEQGKDELPEDAKKGVEDTAEDAEKKVEDAPEDPKKIAEDTTDEAKETTEDATEDTTDEAKDTAEDAEENAEETAEDNLPPLSALEGLTVNKAGKVIDSSGKPIGELVEGDAKKLSRLGSKFDDKGQIWDSRGNVVGKAKTIKYEDYEQEPPFAGLEGLHVVDGGFVEDQGGHRVGKLTEGDAKKLIGRPVDEDGDVTDQHGSVKGHAEPYEEPEEEQPEEEDLSILEGKTVNKAGNVVDEHGKVYGRTTTRDKRLAGRKVDGKGQIWGDDGKVIGKAELIPGGEQEKPEGTFYGLENLKVGKDGVVQDGSGKVVGRVIEGDKAKLAGREVDEDGDILDKNGNTIGKAERWEPEEKKRDVNPMSGRKINREGEVRDADGNLIGKLTSGKLSSLIGKEIDDNGYVVDNDGNKIGEATLLEHIEEPEPEPEGPTPEEQEAQRQAEEDKQLAKKMTIIVSGTLDRVQGICKQISEKVDKAERTPKDELDEEELVKNVKPLLEEGNSILQECNGALRALDPDGRIAANAKARAASHEASPEEHGLAEKLKELTETVVRTIDNGKKKIEGMPHAKKKLNPLWGLLSEPLFQIIAAVGLLLSGVLGLVGRLLDGLGLGSLVNRLLGGLGLDKLLGTLGLTSLTDAIGLTGKK